MWGANENATEVDFTARVRLKQSKDTHMTLCNSKAGSYYVAQPTVCIGTYRNCMQPANWRLAYPALPPPPKKTSSCYPIADEQAH